MREDSRCGGDREAREGKGNGMNKLIELEKKLQNLVDEINELEGRLGL